MTDFRQLSDDYTRVEQAIHYLEQNTHRQPDLAEVAAQVGLSEFHFQRLFTRWAGISPKRFLQFLTKENAKALLARSSVLSTAQETGLSSPGRLHDLFIHAEAVTPGEYKSHGVGLEIVYGFHPTPFGECILGLTQRGICFLGFIDLDHSSALEQLSSHWVNASLVESPIQTTPIVEKIFSPQPGSALTIHLNGTNFQLKVWEALMCLSPGQVISYQGLANQIGETHAARAVGGAVGQNPLAYIIPCHRVILQVGNFGQYRYGSARKKAILLWETSAFEQPI